MPSSYDDSISRCICMTAVALFVAMSGWSLADSPSRPNIVLIVADDLGINQLGAYGGRLIKTPNLDQLAAGGVRFTQAYSGNTVCSPSRISLLTGRDSRLMKDNSNAARLEQTDVTVAHVLKQAGYSTALFGKYSVGYEIGLTDPLAIGFDTWFGMFGILEGHRQYPWLLWEDGRKVRIRENEGGKKGVYAQELFTQKAIDYICQPHTDPYFVLLAYSSPHAELAAPAEYCEPYQESLAGEPYLGMTPSGPSDKYARYYPEPIEKPQATLAGMVAALDDYVGRVVDALEAKGDVRNTLILFTSDNGPHQEGGGDPDFFKAAAPYRGMKRDLYDGGIHVPMIAHWPASITEGRVEETPWCFADVLPTIADLSEVPLHTVPRLESNGVSIRSLLQDDAVDLPERTLYWEFVEQAGDPNSGVMGKVSQAARRGAWKAVRIGREDPVEVYDIENDPGETSEVSDSYPEVRDYFIDFFSNPKDSQE
ncbi:Arylsulfatase [Planctomycetes bacterium MalM25]|nr:Arylsulfatase [Planctomycetes bacterium MalM25]